MPITTTDILQRLPSTSTAPTVTAGANWAAWGSWVQLIASTSGALAVAGVEFAPITISSDQVEIDLGVGGSGSEVSILGTDGHFRFSMGNSGNGQSFGCEFSLDAPLTGLIGSGVRVSARMRAGSALAGQVALLAYPEPVAMTNVAAAGEFPSSLPSGANGASLTPSATPWAWSAYVQLTAGEADGLAFFGITPTVPFGGSAEFEVEVATGGSGSEVPVCLFRGNLQYAAGVITTLRRPGGPYTVDASTPLSLRMRKSGTSTAAWLIALLIIGPTVFADPAYTPPDVETRPATSVRSNRATLNGRINPEGYPATGRFLWSTDPDALTNETLLRSIGTGSAWVAYGATITGLSSGVTYYFRAIGYGPIDTVLGEILSFATTGEHVFIDGEVSQPLTWWRFHDRDDVAHVGAEVDLNDRVEYYDGYKAPNVLNWAKIARGFSDRTGQLQHLDFGLTVSDTTHEHRGYLADPTKRYLTNRPIEEYMIDDEARRIEGLPRLVANGYIADYEPTPNLQFRIDGCDWLKKKFSRKAKAQQAWQPLITLPDFPHAADELFSESGAKISPNAVGKAAPIPYGKVSDKALVSREVVDPGSGSHLVLDPALVDAGIEIPANANAILGASTFANGQGIRFALTGVKAGLEGPFSRIIGTLTLVDGANFHPALSFEQEPDFDSYRIYCYDGYFNPNTGENIACNFIRWKTHDNSTVDGFYGHKFGVEFFGPSDGSDWFTASSPTTTMVDFDTGKGAHAPIWVGPYTLGGRYLQGALLARGACKYIEAGYLNGQPVDLVNDPDWVTPVNTAAWAAAGFTDPYVEVNSTRYTMAFLGGIAGNTLAGITPPVADEIGVAFNLWGLEDIGDGTGDLITRLPQQNKHFVRNFLAPDAPPGQDWLTECDVFSHLPDLTLVDEDSFDAVDDEWENILYGGPEGAFVIGPNGEPTNALDVLADFNVCGDWNAYFKRTGQYALSIEPVFVPAESASVDDVVSIVKDTFSIKDQVSSDFFNILPYEHTEDYTGRSKVGWYSKVQGDLDVRDATSIANYDQERQSPTFELRMLRANSVQGSDTIAAVMARKLARYRHPLRTATFSVSLSGTSIEAGDVFELTAVEGIGAAGWVNRLVRATEHDLDPNLNRVQFSVYDVQPLLVEAT